MAIDGWPIDDGNLESRLLRGRLRHGSRLGDLGDLGDLEPPDDVVAGWYLVAVAGPDTGVWMPITSQWATVGRGRSSGLIVRDRSMSREHFRLRESAKGIAIEDCGSTNGTVLEDTLIDTQMQAADHSYVAAGSSTFVVMHIKAASIAPEQRLGGPAEPFQRQFRAALPALLDKLDHPRAVDDDKSGRRSLLSVVAPLIASAGMGLMIALSHLNKVWIYLPVIALGPVVMATESLRRRRKEAREKQAQLAEYAEKRERFLRDLQEARQEELRRNRWAATPAGMAALLATARHVRLWERSASDADFCEVAIGLYATPSEVVVGNRPEGEAFDKDVQWSAVLRHCLAREGPLAVRGPMERARALTRALVLDLATSHSPGDVKIWLITDIDSDEHCVSEWNVLRWLPHTFSDDVRNTIASTVSSRATALAALRSVISERQEVSGNRRGEIPMLPMHIVIIDCVDAIDPQELTDLLVEGAPVGVVGIVLDERVTPEGSAARLTLGEFADDASFVSETHPRADGVRGIEMTVPSFERAARSLARLRPARSQFGGSGQAEQIRLVDLIDAQTDPDQVDVVIERWRRSGGTCCVRVGGLGDLVTEIDLMTDGPHGLVGGTTRSGKTEFLKSLITSLASANHPDDLSIVIIDFKGGVDHELSARLPHVVDLSTNHDVDSFVRTVRLLDSEIRRREQMFKNAGAPNFDAYRAARRVDASLQPVPRLLLIVDEFSELLSSETGKANLSSLESVTRVGGGLGVHLWLVTQNFENQLPSQIAANAGLRVCFRVQEGAHSKAVLNSPEAATIPKERIGRAFLRSHAGAPREFQAARVAGPKPGREAVVAPVTVNPAPFAALSDASAQPPPVDVPAVDTDMYAVIEVIRRAAEATGWTKPAIPWPAELPLNLSLADLSGGELTWPVGLVDEPEKQRQSPVGLERYGPSLLLLGGSEARLGETARAMIAAAAVRHSPEEMHFYVIDLLGQGLGVLRGYPHVGAVAERSETLATRLLKHIAQELALRKSALADIGVASIAELHATAAEALPETVVVVNGADRLLSHAEGEPSPLLPLLMGVVGQASGTGVRFILTGTPALAHQRLGSSIGRRFVLRCPDPSDYAALGVPRQLHGALVGFGRAADAASGRLMQFAQVPATADASARDVLQALGNQLREVWEGTAGSALLPTELRELHWPLPFHAVGSARLPDGVHQPVAFCVNGETGELLWLDAEEDGPAFIVCGSPGSGRSNALIAGAELMSEQGWCVLGMPLSRRSPLTEGTFPGELVTAGDLTADCLGSRQRVALFIDDANRWSGDADWLREFMAHPGDRAAIAAGPTDFFSGRSEFTRAMSARAALVLTPKSSLDASEFGLRRLSEDVLRDSRPGRGVLVVAGVSVVAQVPLVSRR
ncbi:FtsK/SpoIIIE domain-containing protein [Candidatus Poriferisodalis sp.]|uniref:FtsK/SpoIIIE domain-containing protein n=1 Tax=Candidatus Poriferisodalis sp. TaxID=3101277 RepID=UPI003AF4B323